MQASFFHFLSLFSSPDIDWERKFSLWICESQLCSYKNLCGCCSDVGERRRSELYWIGCIHSWQKKWHCCICSVCSPHLCTLGSMHCRPWISCCMLVASFAASFGLLLEPWHCHGNVGIRSLQSHGFSQQSSLQSDDCGNHKSCGDWYFCKAWEIDDDDDDDAWKWILLHKLWHLLDPAGCSFCNSTHCFDIKFPCYHTVGVQSCWRKTWRSSQCNSLWRSNTISNGFGVECSYISSCTSSTVVAQQQDSGSYQAPSLHKLSCSTCCASICIQCTGNHSHWICFEFS